MPLVLKKINPGTEQLPQQRSIATGASSGYTTMYIPDFLTWEDTGVVSPVAQGAVIRVGNKLYMFGGANSVNSNVSTIYSASWAENPTFSDTGFSLPVTGNGFRVGIVNEKVYVFGDDGSRQGIYSASLSSPLNWGYSGVDLPERRDNAPLVIANDRILLIKGYNGSSGFATISSASLSNPLSFTSTPSFGFSSWETGAFTADNSIFFAGGFNSNTAVYKASISSPNTLDFNISDNSLPIGSEGKPTFYFDGSYVYMFGNTTSGGNVYVTKSEFATISSYDWSTISNVIPVTNRYNRNANWIGPDGRYYFVNSDYTSRKIYRSGRKAVRVLNEVSSSYPAYAGLPGTLNDGTPAIVNSHVRLGFEPWRTNRTGSF